MWYVREEASTVVDYHTGQLYIEEVFRMFSWPRIEELPPMPKSKVTERKAALLMIEACPAEKFKKHILSIITQGGAVMYGQTRSGKALVITTFLDDERSKEYPEELEELYEALSTSNDVPF